MKQNLPEYFRKRSEIDNSSDGLSKTTPGTLSQSVS
jgi:hypothetical protein